MGWTPHSRHDLRRLPFASSTPGRLPGNVPGSGGSLIWVIMKIFLQDKRTERYFSQGDQWAEFSTDALDFPNYDKAVEFALRHGLSGVQVVLKFPDHPYRICLPFRRGLAASQAA